MKFNKEEIQKIVLSSLLLVALLYCYFTFLLKPRDQKVAIAQAEMAALTPKLQAARGQLVATGKLETEAPAAEDRLALITKMIPEGSPIAWFPPQVTNFFKSQGMKDTTVRLTREADAGADLPNFRKLSWVIEVRNVPFRAFGIALAAWENQMPLVQIEQLQIEPSNTDVETQNYTFSITNIVK